MALSFFEMSKKSLPTGPPKSAQKTSLHEDQMDKFLNQHSGFVNVAQFDTEKYSISEHAW